MRLGLSLKGATVLIQRSYLLLVIFFFSLFGEGWSETTSWDLVKARMTAEIGYSVNCEYVGPEGNFFFRYVIHAGGQPIFTEVLDGSTRGAGTRVMYDPTVDRDNVTMQTSFLRLRRSLQARDIKDSPLYQPLFAHLLKEISEGNPREVSHLGSDTTLFLFGSKAAVHEYLQVDKDGNPMTLTRMEAKKQVNRLTFRELEWGDQAMNWEKE